MSCFQVCGKRYSAATYKSGHKSVSFSPTSIYFFSNAKYIFDREFRFQYTSNKFFLNEKILIKMGMDEETRQKLIVDKYLQDLVLFIDP